MGGNKKKSLTWSTDPVRDRLLNAAKSGMARRSWWGVSFAFEIQKWSLQHTTPPAAAANICGILSYSRDAKRTQSLCTLGHNEPAPSFISERRQNVLWSCRRRVVYILVRGVGQGRVRPVRLRPHQPSPHLTKHWFSDNFVGVGMAIFHSHHSHK